MTRHEREIHALQDHVDELPLDRMDTMQQQINGSYTIAEATQQDMDALYDALVLAHGQIFDLEFCLDESEAREATLKTCIRALEKRFGPYDTKNANKQTRPKFCAIEQLIAECVADALTAYEANPNIDTGVNDGTSGSVRGVEHTTCGCSYKDFLTCKPCNFNKTEGAVGLTRWFENMESVKGIDIIGYTKRFQELALLFPTMVTLEYKKIERYIWGLIEEIQGNAAKSVDNKRKWDDNQRGNSGQQNKRQEVVRAFTEGSSKKKGYARTAPHCNRCKLHHNRPYTIQCKNYKRVGQRIGDCKTPTLATAATTQRTSVTCFECGVKGHFRSKCT
ncbi:putative reverse transcriptase domain-containing protein [Tanacetum coccineum]